jgi:hypothetical protein
MGEGDFEGKQYVHQILYTELKTFVDTQQYLFDNLCSHSVPAKEKIREIGQRVIRQGNLPVNLQYIAKPLETKISTLVIDQAVSLAIEINDDTKITFEESTGIAIYSNSESKISSSLTIFETLWIQSEIDIQNKVKQAYFQMFKGFQFKDELYTRRWSFDQQKSKRDKTL